MPTKLESVMRGRSHTHVNTLGWQGKQPNSGGPKQQRRCIRLQQIKNPEVGEVVAAVWSEFQLYFSAIL